MESMIVAEANTAPLETTTNSRKLTSRQWMTVGMLACANLFSTLNYSCIFPFFPGEAKQKGLTLTDVGIIFGIYELAMLILFPVFGKYMHLVGPRKAFSFGLFFSGIITIIFGFVNLLPNGRSFFWTAFGLKCIIALGDAAFMTSSFVISAKCFPGRINTIVGIMETSLGIGVSSGSVIGGVLYEYGGFHLPFFIISFLLILMSILSTLLIQKFDESVDDSENEKGMLGILKISTVWIMIFAVIICGMCSTFVGPTLADHLAEFKLSVIFIGLMFFIRQSMFAVSAPIVGMLIDRWQCRNVVMIFGAITMTIAVLLIGPSPLLHLEKNLIFVGLSLAMLGLGVEGLYLPTYKCCLDAVKKHGYPDTVKTYGYVTGIMESAFAFGCFVGPTLGSFGADRIGFEWTTTGFALINTIFIIILITPLIHKKFRIYPRPLETSRSEKE